MDIEILKQLVAEKLTLPQIGERLSVSTKTAWNLLQKHGLKTYRYIDCDPDATVKTCRYCDTERPIAEFPLASVIKGKRYIRNKCNICYLKMKADRRYQIINWFRDLRKQFQCKSCGNQDHRVLEFHHTASDKEFNVSEGASHGMSKKKILAEIEKCDVLCANCHRILHYEERLRDVG